VDVVDVGGPELWELLDRVARTTGAAPNPILVKWNDAHLSVLGETLGGELNGDTRSSRLPARLHTGLDHAALNRPTDRENRNLGLGHTRRERGEARHPERLDSDDGGRGVAGPTHSSDTGARFRPTTASPQRDLRTAHPRALRQSPARSPRLESIPSLERARFVAIRG
jgi:hypothetical protein